MKSFDEVVGEAVRTNREHSKQTTAELAARLEERTRSGWTREKMNRIESGRRQLRAAELVLVAEALRVSVDDLLPVTKAAVDIDGAPVHLSRVKVQRPPSIARAAQELVDESERHADTLRAIAITMRGVGR